MRRLTITLATVTALCLALAVTSASAAAPLILKTFSSQITSGSARLQAEVNPEGKAGKFHFEYGLADCASNPCAATPEAALKKGTEPIEVKADVTNLLPEQTYHFRVIATNGEKATGPDTTFTTYSAPQVFAPCPNDSFRSGRPAGLLPDCRAYEQASPLDKNGTDARGRVSWVKAARDGSAISYGAAGAIPGAEGSQELPAYLASRGSGDWSTQGLLPPQGAGQEAFVLGWTPDFSQSFSSVRRLGPPSETAFLGRSSTGGHALTEIAPYGSGVVNPSFAGATADGSKVVFESKAKLTSTAIAGVSNVYAWDKVTKTLRLAGALNSASPGGEGQSPLEGAFAGSYDWIAGTSSGPLHKGGSASNYYTQDQHAIAADGSVIFTGAGSGQLYMRLNPTEKQSAIDGSGNCTEPSLACTLHVSATQKDNGTGPAGTDAAGTQPAAFMAASTDGSSVLFTSSEKLTDDATTGPEPVPPAIGRSGLDGTTGKTLSFCPNTLSKGVAVDATHIYWTDPKAGTVNRADLPNCSNPQVLVNGADEPQYVAVDAGHLYWTNAAGGEDGEGTIGRADIDGSDIDQSCITGASNPQGIAVGGGFIYWTNAHDNPFETRSIGRANLDCTGVSQAFIGQGTRNIAGIAVDATHLYWTFNHNGADTSSRVVRGDLDGNNEISVFLGFGSNPQGVTVDNSHVYWAQQGTSTIGRSSLDLTGIDSEFLTGAGHPLGLAVDGGNLYWSVNGELPVNPGNDLYRYEAKADGSGQLVDLTVDSAVSDPNGAEVLGILGASDDASGIYFVANGVLAAGATKGNCKGSADISISFTGECNLYLSRDGEPTHFIARLNALGASTADVTDVTNWLPHGGLLGQIGKTARVSSDGSTVLFRSQQKLTAYDNEGVPELYRYRAGDPAPTCVSCNPTGGAAGRAPTFGNISLSTVTPPDPAFVLSRNLSANGNRVFFQSTDALVGADTNGEDGCVEEGSASFTFPSCQDVYEWEANNTGSCKSETQGGGCLYLLSTGKSTRASFLGDASASGDDVFLITSEPGLVRRDQDQLFDVYDARAGGGLAAQEVPPKVPCETADACHEAAKPGPVFESPGSAAFKGPGNVKQKKPSCPKGKRKVHSKGKTRCVAKKKHKGKNHKSQKQHKRAAENNGRASR